MKYFIAFFIAAILISGCTTTVHYQGLRPADVSLPREIKSVVLVNRYKPEKQNKWWNVLEGIFTGEVPFADRGGVERAMAGLQQVLQSGPKYKVVIANEQLSGSGTGMFPEPMSQAVIIGLCNQYQADAVISLEAFDSDIFVTAEPKTRKRTVDGKEIKETYFEAREVVKINMGWRLYEGSGGALIDQHEMFVSQVFTNSASTLNAARNGLLFPVEAIQRTGFDGGMRYASRVAPTWVSYSREIYTKAKRYGGMKIAKRMARRGDWEQAALTWQKLSQVPVRKVAARATYNLAVAYEMQGDIDKALEYARIAADKYGLRKADNYIWMLNSRRAELYRLDQQLGE